MWLRLIHHCDRINPRSTMWKIVLLLAVVVMVCADQVTDGTTLVQTFLIHRHGDRTPVKQNLALTTDPDAVESASAKYGYGQLTDVGKQRAHKLGQYIRDRYSALLSPQYNKSEIYLRSTDSTRTKMTCLTAMAATYPGSNDNWSKELPWTPVPYTTVPIKYDFNMASLNCPTFLTKYNANLYSSPSSMKRDFSDVLDVFANVTGVPLLREYPVFAFAFYDAYASQESLGIPVTAEIAATMPRLKEAAGAAMDVLFDDDTLQYMAGVLLNEFFTYSSIIISGEDTPRVRIYSSHDINVFTLMAASKVPSQGVPRYAVAFSLELRRVDETGQYVVLPVYKPDPSEEPVYLQIKGCDLLCDVNQFKDLVSEHLLDESTWRNKCDFSDDMVIDDSSVA